MIRPVRTQIFAVIGTPIKHSLSPVMMNKAFKVLGIDAVYLALEVDNPQKDLQILLDSGFQGLSVTIPHKEVVYSMVESVDDVSSKLGAVNTLKKVANAWRGRNTDWIGIVRTFGRRNIPVNGKKALIIGAGGAARAAVYAAKYMGMDVTVTNRTYERAVKLKEDFGCNILNFEEATEKGSDFDVIFQTTPIGMSGYKKGLVLPPTIFRPQMVVMDFVYNPVITDFLAEARNEGCMILSGLEMLLYQGAAQIEWWFNRPAPVAAMREVLIKAAGAEDYEFC